jgi:hypothetical protein
MIRGTSTILPLTAIYQQERDELETENFRIGADDECGGGLLLAGVRALRCGAEASSRDQCRAAGKRGR